MSDAWRPLSIREGSEESDYAGPFAGVPDWLFGPLWTWLVERYPLRLSTKVGPRWNGRAIADYRGLAMAIRVSLDDSNQPNPSNAQGLQSRLYSLVFNDPAVLLDCVDYALHTGNFTGGYLGDSVRAPTELDELLTRAGSIYRVQVDAAGHFLTRRVAPETQATADALLKGGDRPAEYLSRAWRAVYGRSPNPGEGYREAVRAVEAASIPIVSPTNDRATLGTIIRDMKAAPHKWRVALRHHTPTDQVQSVIGMLDLLWVGQTGRHADPDQTHPVDVTQEQAEAGLALALTLVAWFKNGTVTRV